MRKHSVLASGALVLISLVVASLACYSGQVPGVFELTPYSTPTAIPKAENARFSLLETVLAPLETGFPFFNLTLFPEPLQNNLLNSKALCEGNSPATILYAGDGPDNATYYLIDCTGAVGWAAESRLAGPLKFQQQDRALTVSETSQALQLLDPTTFQPMISFMQCLPETVVDIQNIQVADANKDGAREVYYLIECPPGNKGYVGNDSLFGPVKVKVGDRALASAAGGEDVMLTDEPGPATDDNRVDDCADGTELNILEAKRAAATAYYRVQCGEVEGWLEQVYLTGPLTYQRDDFVVLYVPSQFVFVDELPPDAAGEIAVVDEDAGTDGDPETTEDPVEATTLAAGEIRPVVEYTPPAYLTGAPGPVILGGEERNIVGQCSSETTAHILDYQAAADAIYYQVTCDRCADTDEAGACLTSEPQQGWIEQVYLQGPLDYVPGARVRFRSGSKAVITDEETDIQYARIPSNITGASAIGEFTTYAGRCLYEDGMEVTGVVLDKARTSNRFIFYFTVECEGQVAVMRLETDHEGKTRPVITYDAEETSLVRGYALGKDLVDDGG